MAAGEADFEGDTVIDAFDPLEGGANFKLKIKTVKEKNGRSYPNYDECAFLGKGSLEVSDEEFEKIFNSLHDINQYIDPTNNKLFKETEYLQKRLDKVVGKTPVTETIDELDEDETTDTVEETVTETLTPKTSVTSKVEVDTEEDEEMDDADDYFDDLG